MLNYLGKFNRNSDLEILLNDTYYINTLIQEDYLLIIHVLSLMTYYQYVLFHLKTRLKHIYP